MQSNILYDRSTTLPNIRGHFHRPRIDGLLSRLLDCHLIAVTAGAGWGKTHAVSAFLSNAHVCVIWLQLSGLDNHVERFWEEFIYILEYQNKGTAARLEQLGFPDTIAKFDRFLHILAKEIYASEQVVFVFDDFHLISDETVTSFIENLINARLENFCVIINSRTKLNCILNLSSMFANELAGCITAEDLYFTPDETEEYLKQQDITLSARELKRVQDFTGGWPMALYLVGLSIKKGGTVSKDPIAGAIPSIFEMIERELFSAYTPQVQNFLIRASLLNSFRNGIIKSLAGGCLDTILEFLNNNMFIYYNPYTEHYNFHHLFLEFLNTKQIHLTQQEKEDTYMKAAGWCVENDLKLEAFAYYDKCGQYEKILDIMLYNHFVATFSKSLADFYIGIIEKFPVELMKKNPIVRVHHAGLLLNNAEIQPAVKELLAVKNELEALALTEDNKYVLGNLYFYLGLLRIAEGDYDFIELFKKSDEYLSNKKGMADNTGRSVNTKYAITLNSIAQGELKRMEDALFCAIPHASKAMSGYAYGMEYLASAEAAYFTGDMKKAAKCAYEAVYRAREKQVIDVASSGYFLLMRIEAANGNYEGIISHLEQFRAYMDGVDDKWNFNGMLDIAEGWFYLLIGKIDKVAGWIVDDISGNVLAPFSMGMERLIKARYLLRVGKYYELLAWLGQSEELFRRYNMWLILLDMLIYKSIASHYIHDEAQTELALREAYEIAHGNNLVMQFVELGNDIRNVVYNIKHSDENTLPDAWLTEIYTKAETYARHIRSIKSRHHQVTGNNIKPLVKITEREKEMLGYLCQGLKNTEIASACFISLSAVKKTLNSIYIKLGATNRADAVRIALQTGLNK